MKCLNCLEISEAYGFIVRIVEAVRLWNGACYTDSLKVGMATNRTSS